MDLLWVLQDMYTPHTSGSVQKCPFGGRPYKMKFQSFHIMELYIILADWSKLPKDPFFY